LVVLFLLIAALGIIPLRWRLVLTEQGILRRRLFRWDLWSWDDLASGHVRKLYPNTIHDPRRRWWIRKLNLGHLSDEDQTRLSEIINSVYRFPPLPEIPETLTIKYQMRNKATFDASGIHLSKRGQKTEYRWEDVRYLRLLQTDPLRRDFRTLQLFLPDEVIELQMVTHQGGSSPAWRGATAEVLMEYLVRHLPENKVDYDVVGECPSRVEYAERALRKLVKNLRETRLCIIACGCLLGGLAIYCLWVGQIGPFLSILINIVVFGPVVWWMRRMTRTHFIALKTQLEELQAAERN
jgi:hypothetical protein